MEQSITDENINHCLIEWSKYINSEEFDILKEFTYKTANNIPFDKLLIFCGSGSTGKSTLVKKLVDLIGKDNCVYAPLIYKTNDLENEEDEEEDDEECLLNYNCSKSLIVYHHENNLDVCDLNIKDILARKHILKKKMYQLPEYNYPKANQILVSNDISKLNKELLMCSNIIHFTHKF